MTDNQDGYDLDALSRFMGGVQGDTEPSQQDMIAAANALRDALFKGIDLRSKLFGKYRALKESERRKTIQTTAFSIMMSHLNGEIDKDVAVDCLMKELKVGDDAAKKYYEATRPDAENTLKTFRTLFKVGFEKPYTVFPWPDTEAQARAIRADRSLSGAQKLKHLMNSGMTKEEAQDFLAQ